MVRFLRAEDAEWWEKQRLQSEKELERFVQDNPGWFAISVATFLSTAMELGGAFVDVLRLGEGAAEGGWGYGKDALRLLTIPGLAGSVGRLGRLGAAAITEMRLLKIAPISSSLPICSWVAATQALRLTGVRHLAAVDDLLKWSGWPTLEQGFKESAFLREIIGALRILGAKIVKLRAPKTLTEVTAAVAENPKGVVLINVKWPKLNPATGEVQYVGHTLTAFRDWIGNFRILDRSGRVVSALDELENLYPGIGKGVPYDEMYFMAEALVVQVMNQATSILAMEVNALILDKRKAEQEIERLRTQEERRRRVLGYSQ
ncbi:MAG: hypothetical protein M3220_06645 [Chloroflexota bacterium]|nr:hypothetical protein [Chloroflexota bacterium]